MSLENDFSEAVNLGHRRWWRSFGLAVSESGVYEYHIDHIAFLCSSLCFSGTVYSFEWEVRYSMLHRICPYILCNGGSMPRRLLQVIYFNKPDTLAQQVYPTPEPHDETGLLRFSMGNRSKVGRVIRNIGAWRMAPSWAR